MDRNLTSLLRISSRYLSKPRASCSKTWICSSCRSRTYATSVKIDRPKKPYYLTTPIFYVNAAPHVGHLYTMILTDIIKRWQVLKERNAILCTGTDEHGLKIQQAAAQANTPPKEFCDLTAETFKALAKQAEISNDHFVRTTDEDHKAAVQYFWTMLKDRGHIYESVHEGWYCVSDETFYPANTIEKRQDPYTGRLFMSSQETGKEVEWTSERNYHFRLSRFEDRLLNFYKANPEWIVPASRMNDVVNWVSAGLQDLSISRPVERLSWGVRVPDDESQTIYVWLDALINYITKAGYPFTPGKEDQGGWPADLQVIGKDIVRFHCIYWPAFLMALNIDPPKQILTHAHWTLGRQKMAKSTGNVVNPFFALDRFGVDLMRYYLAHDGGISDDSDYGNHLIVERYKKGLQGGLGNLVSRVTRSKVWNVQTAVETAASGGLMEADAATKDMVRMLKSVRAQVNAEMKQLHAGAALKSIMETVYETNRYLQECEPWTAAKTGREADTEHVTRTIYHCSEAIRIVGILLQPYMPTKMSQLLDMMGVDESRRTFKDAYLGVDNSYGKSKLPLGYDRWDSLFPPLPVET